MPLHKIDGFGGDGHLLSSDVAIRLIQFPLNDAKNVKSTLNPDLPRNRLPYKQCLLYRDRLKGAQILLCNSQAGPGRKVKQEQEDISRNHVQAF